VPDDSANGRWPHAVWYDDAPLVAGSPSPAGRCRRSPADLYILYTGRHHRPAQVVLWRQAYLYPPAALGAATRAPRKEKKREAAEFRLRGRTSCGPRQTRRRHDGAVKKTLGVIHVPPTGWRSPPSTVVQTIVLALSHPALDTPPADVGQTIERESPTSC